MRALWLIAGLALLIIGLPVVAFFALLGELLHRLSRACWYIAVNLVPREWRERLRQKLEERP
jgi:hypothetical protein